MHFKFNFQNFKPGLANETSTTVQLLVVRFLLSTRLPHRSFADVRPTPQPSHWPVEVSLFHGSRREGRDDGVGPQTGVSYRAARGRRPHSRPIYGSRSLGHGRDDVGRLAAWRNEPAPPHHALPPIDGPPPDGQRLHDAPLQDVRATRNAFHDGSLYQLHCTNSTPLPQSSRRLLDPEGDGTTQPTHGLKLSK